MFAIGCLGYFIILTLPHVAPQHTRFINETKEREPDVVIFGDSITSQLETRCVWREVFVPMHALNFSIIGDLVQQVLWRVQNGELDNINPKVGLTMVICSSGQSKA